MTIQRLHPETDEQYYTRNLGEVSSSLLKDFRRSALHYWYACNGGPTKETAALTFGRALHCAVLEPHLFDSSFLEMPDFGDMRTKAAREAKADYMRAWGDSGTFLPADDMATLHGMVQGLERSGLFSIDGLALEQVVRWEELGLRCRAKPDAFDEATGTLWDMKSARDASPSGIRSACWSHGYPYQLAFYRRGLIACGYDVKRICILGGEKTAPFAWGAYELDMEELDRFEGEIAVELADLARCVETNTWTGYTTEPQPLSLYRAQREPDMADDYDIESETEAAA